MGTGVVEHKNPRTGAVTDITDYVDRDTFRIELQANRLNGIARLTIRDESGVLDIRERDEIRVSDDAVRVYGGEIATLDPRTDGSAIEYVAKCQSFSALLDQRVIEDMSTAPAAPCFDDDLIAWIVSYGADLGLDGTTFVSRIRTDAFTSVPDFSGKTLRQAIEHLGSYCGGWQYWVDEGSGDTKYVHWLDPASAQLVDNPDFEDGTTNWSLDAAAAVDADGGPGGTGDGALVVTGDGVGRHETTQTVTGVTGSRRYMLFADLDGADAVIRFDWQDASSVSQRIDSLTGAAGWTRQRAVVTAPASATKVVVRAGGVNNFATEVRHDNISVVGEDAAWGISTSPDGTTTRKFWKWRRPTDATTPINRVLVRGDGISGWREHAASIAYYGRKFEGILNDDRVTSTDGIDSRSAYVFRKYAFPTHSGSYTTDAAGLAPGTFQIIEHELLGITAIEWVATLAARFVGNGNMEYDVTFGAPEDDMGAVMASVQSAFGEAIAEVGVPLDPSTVDTNAPAIPTGLALSSGSREANDGTQAPYLLATWAAVADVDLDAYELAIDRAITSEVAFTASASGTGGALPAGDYAVMVTGEGDEGGETGVTSAPQVVTIAAGQRLYVNITALTGCSTYKVYASILAGSETQPQDTGQTTTTTGSDVEVPAAGAGAVYPPTTSTAVGFTTPTTHRMRDVSYYTENVIGGVYYAARVRAIDASGNASGWSSLVTATAAVDTSPPAIPTGVTLSTGFRVIGVRWQRNPEADLGGYQVRYAPESSPGSGVPDTESWARIDTATNWIIVSGLDAGSADGTTDPVTYFVQVRALDRSGNVATSALDSTAVPAVSNSEAGWSNDGTNEAYISAAPILLSGQTDVAYASIVSDHIAASGIDAGVIKTGTLSVGGQPNMADFLLVYDTTGREIGRWDQEGFVVKDPDDTDRQVRIVSGVLSFSTDGGATWTTALSGDGIKADAITLGTAPGGHNAVPNASFELAAFATLLDVAWEGDNPWGTTIGTDVNVTKNTADLRLTTYTF